MTENSDQVERGIALRGRTGVMHKVTAISLSAFLALGMTTGLAACGSSNSSSSDDSATEQAQEEPQDTRPSLGSEGTAELSVTNDLGQDVTQIWIKPSSEESWPESPLDLAGATFEQGVESVLHYSPADASTNDTSYDVWLKGADGTSYEFDGLQLQQYSEASFEFGDDVAYVNYTLDDGTTGSTHDAAVQAKADADAAAAQAQADAAAAAQAQADAQPQANTNAQAQAQPTQKQSQAQSQGQPGQSQQKAQSQSQQKQSQPSQQSQQPKQQQSQPKQQAAPSNSAPAAPQQEDNCATDVILN